MIMERSRHTVQSIQELDDIEALAADGAAVGPFHPWPQTIIVEDMTARQHSSNLADISSLFALCRIRHSFRTRSAAHPKFIVDAVAIRAWQAFGGGG